jgi:hypothetical protein
MAKAVRLALRPAERVVQAEGRYTWSPIQFISLRRQR